MRSTLAVDLDGTLAGMSMLPGRHIGPVVDHAKTVLQRFKDAGWQVILYTVRPDEWFLREWCDLHFPGIFDGINCNPADVVTHGIVAAKPYAEVYLDDRAWPNRPGHFDWFGFERDAEIRGWVPERTT